MGVGEASFLSGSICDHLLGAGVGSFGFWLETEPGGFRLLLGDNTLGFLSEGGDSFSFWAMAAM